MKRRKWDLSKLLIKTFDKYRKKFIIGHFFSSPVKMNLKFRLKFNRGFINGGCFDCAIIIFLYNFNVTRVHEARDSQFFFQNVQNEFLQNVQKQHEINHSSLLN